VTPTMRAKQQRLYINIDHVATLRQARRGSEPDPVEAATACEAAGADGITAPTSSAVEQSRKLGVAAIELHTGTYSQHPESSNAIDALRDAARRGADLGLAVHAGHGLTVRNVGLVAVIPEIEELNIGHSIISRSVFIGLDSAVKEMREAMRAARSS